MYIKRIVASVVLLAALLTLTTGCLLFNERPVAKFTAEQSSGTLKVNFDASGSYDPDGDDELSYYWRFGDGETDTGEMTSHTYKEPETYEVFLAVTDSGGMPMTGSLTEEIQVTAPDNTPPIASFTPDKTSGPAPLTVEFDASASSDPDGSIVSYAWDFGDGGSDTGVTVSHTYQSPGTYQVELTVTDDAGDADFATREITVSSGCGCG